VSESPRALEGPGGLEPHDHLTPGHRTNDKRDAVTYWHTADKILPTIVHLASYEHTDHTAVPLSGKVQTLCIVHVHNSIISRTHAHDLVEKVINSSSLFRPPSKDKG
jgi:hypothetical protein